MYQFVLFHQLLIRNGFRMTENIIFLFLAGNNLVKKKTPCRVQRKSVLQLVIRSSRSFSPSVIFTSHKKILISRTDYSCYSNIF